MNEYSTAAEHCKLFALVFALSERFKALASESGHFGGTGSNPVHVSAHACGFFPSKDSVETPIFKIIKFAWIFDQLRAKLSHETGEVAELYRALVQENGLFGSVGSNPALVNMCLAFCANHITIKVSKFDKRVNDA